MNWKRLLYPLDGERATMSEHRLAHECAASLWVTAIFVIVAIAIYAGSLK